MKATNQNIFDWLRKNWELRFKFNYRTWSNDIRCVCGYMAGDSSLGFYKEIACIWQSCSCGRKYAFDFETKDRLNKVKRFTAIEKQARQEKQRREHEEQVRRSQSDDIWGEDRIA